DLDSEWWRERSRRFSGLKARVYEAEAERLRAVEIMGARHATRCLVTTPEAAPLVASFAPHASVTVIPKGIDLEASSPHVRAGGASVIGFNPYLERESEARAATQFCNEILPRVHARVARTKLLVGCKSFFPMARRLAGLSGVEMSAPVSSLRGLLRRSTVAVAPKRFGTETRRGLLEAIAAGGAAGGSPRGRGRPSPQNRGGGLPGG